MDNGAVILKTSESWVSCEKLTETQSFFFFEKERGAKNGKFRNNVIHRLKL